MATLPTQDQIDGTRIYDNLLTVLSMAPVWNRDALEIAIGLLSRPQLGEEPGTPEAEFLQACIVFLKKCQEG